MDEPKTNTDAKGQPLAKNPNWQGGRTITSHGYVLVKRPDHPQADTRGYVYEHRLVAEETLGRQLTADEQVHHKNGDKQDNRPENLEVLTTAEHRAAHRERDNRRDPGEPNPVIKCACGCGETFAKYDDAGRPRQYVTGHNPQESPTRDAVLNALAEGPMRRQDIAKAIEKNTDAVASALTRLNNAGKVDNPKRGVWALPEDAGTGDTERQENPTATCACGCGETFPKYDEHGRSREYVSGHNNKGQIREGVLDALAHGPMKRATLADTLNASRNSVGTALRRLREDGLVENADGWGMWKRAEERPNEGETDE